MKPGEKSSVLGEMLDLITHALPRPAGGAPVSPSPMARAETEKALVEDSAGRVSLVKDWRSILVDDSGEESVREERSIGCGNVSFM